MTNIDLRHGDCLDVLAELADCSVDAVITDPPYGLANTDPAHVADTIVRWVNGDRDYLPGGHGFMGKAWDAFVPPVAVWDECLRVLKPGGHVLAFAGSRTVDLMTLGLRLAGFDIRDSIAWLYGSGFPKSLDVSKAIDKRPGVMRHAEFAQHLAERRTAAGMSRADVSEAVVGTRTGACWNWEHHQFPEAKWWPALRDLLGLDEDTWGPVIAEAERQKVGTRAGNRLAVAPGQGMDRSAVDLDVTTHATDAARTWQGWGSAMKPAFEPVVVARKPFKGTLAANVLQHGTGALNIDACRVGREEGDRTEYGRGNHLPHANTTASLGKFAEVTPYEPHAAGRWPANVVLDETQATALDQQSGESREGNGELINRGTALGMMNDDGWQPSETKGVRYPGEGGASRYFFVAKGLSCEWCGQDMTGWHRDARDEHLGTHYPPVLHIPDEYADKPVAPQPFLYTPKAPADERVRVNGTAHPTVKPLSLMRWLVRLVTPPGGTVLEPFAGSGTTVEACILEGFHCVAIEREADYLPLIRQRIARRRDPVEAVRGAGEDGGLFDLLEGETA